MITYDLHAPGRDYSDLHDAIKALGPWWHYLESTWIVVTTLSPAAVWSRLESVVDTNDNVLVIDVTGRARAGWLPQAAWDWLGQRL